MTTKLTEQNYRFEPHGHCTGERCTSRGRKEGRGEARERGPKPWRGLEGSGQTVAAATERRRTQRPGSGPGEEWRAHGGSGRRQAAAMRLPRRARGRALGLWIGSGIATPFSHAHGSRSLDGENFARRGNKVADGQIGNRDSTRKQRWPGPAVEHIASP